MAVRKSKQLNFHIFDKEFALDVNLDIEDCLQAEMQFCNSKLAELQASFPNQNHETHLCMYILWRAGKYAEEQLQMQEQLSTYREKLQSWQAQMASPTEEPIAENPEPYADFELP